MGFEIKIEGNRSFEHALEIFRRETKGTLEEYKERSAYKKPSQKRHENEMKRKNKNKRDKRRNNWDKDDK